MAEPPYRAEEYSAAVENPRSVSCASGENVIAADPAAYAATLLRPSKQCHRGTGSESPPQRRGPPATLKSQEIRLGIRGDTPSWANPTIRVERFPMPTSRGGTPRSVAKEGRTQRSTVTLSISWSRASSRFSDKGTPLGSRSSDGTMASGTASRIRACTPHYPGRATRRAGAGASERRHLLLPLVLLTRAHGRSARSSGIVVLHFFPRTTPRSPSSHQALSA